MPDTLVWPLRVARDGRLVSVEQHDPADVASCVTAIAATPLGWDFAQPEFGMSRDGLFRQGGIDPNTVIADVQRLEPRADPVVIAGAIGDMLDQRVIVDPAGEVV
jgi:hypothetical protein